MRSLTRSAFTFFRRRRGWLAALGVLALLAVYQSNARFIGGSDVYPARFIPVSLVTEFDYDLDEFRFLRGEGGTGGVPGGQVFPNDEGKPYAGRVLSYYPTLVPTLLSPFYFVPFRAMELSPKHYLVFYMDKFFASAFAAFSALFLFWALREVRTPRSAALMIAAAYALGTSTWAIGSQALWQHGPSQCFLALTLWLWVRSDRTNSGYFWLGLAMGGAVGARNSDAFWAGLLLLDLLFRRHWRGLGLYALGGMPAFCFLFFHNWLVFGRPWISGYQFNPVQVYMDDWLAWANLPAGGLGLLFSPSLGLIPNAPFYLFLPLAVWIALRRPLRGQNRRYVLLPLAFAAAHWMLYGSYREWWAGWSFCYRYMTDVLPMLSFLLFALWRARPPGVGGQFAGRMWRCMIWTLFAAFALWGTAVQAFGAYLWGGHWFYNWENINRQLRLDWKNEVPGTIFNHPSVIWSLDYEKHLIGSEFKHHVTCDLDNISECSLADIRWQPERWFTTPGKVYHDLFVKRHIEYGEYAPIILNIGAR